jgi:hypothetical protein
MPNKWWIRRLREIVHLCPFAERVIHPPHQKINKNESALNDEGGVRRLEEAMLTLNDATKTK